MQTGSPPAGWLAASLQETIREELETSRETSSGWKQTFTRYGEKEKKERLIEAIEELKSGTTLSSFQFRECFRVLEDIALSPRVSDLNRQHYYTRVVRGRNNHVLSLKGIACYLKDRYPNARLYFASHICNDSLTCLRSSEIMTLRTNMNNSVHVEEVELDRLLKLAGKTVFVVYQYSQTFHKMLFILQKTSGAYTLSFFDSLGINPWRRINGDEPYFYQMKSLMQIFSARCGSQLTVHALAATRQKDQVNCGSFVTFDFELAFKFISEGTPLFKDSMTAHEAFFEISQQDHDLKNIPVQLKRYRSLYDPAKEVNLKASMVALDILKFYLENKTCYPQENSRFEEESEEDEEGCVIC